MYTASVNFNRAAERWALRHGKPLVGNADVHRLYQLGTIYSVVDAQPDADAICAAIAMGRVRVEGGPLSWSAVARTLTDMFTGEITDSLRRPSSPQLNRAHDSTKRGIRL